MEIDSEGRIRTKHDNKLEAQCAEPVSLTFLSVLRNLYTEPSIGVRYQITVHLGTRFQRRAFFFRNQPISNKNCLWWPCLLTDRDELRSLYRDPAIDASYQVSVHLAKRFQWRRCLENNQSETKIACGGNVCYQIGTR